MSVPPSNRTAGLVRGVPQRYVAGADTRGRQEGRPYPWSQQVIHKISGLYLKPEHLLLVYPCGFVKLVIHICHLSLVGTLTRISHELLSRDHEDERAT
jgi:hypothetical protein